jgi:hypothetical protein
LLQEFRPGPPALRKRQPYKDPLPRPVSIDAA